MSSWLKNFLLIILKNAINAVITNVGLMTMLHGAFNLTSTQGLWNIGKATLSVVASREAMVWGPIVLKWTTTNADPNTTVMTNIKKT